MADRFPKGIRRVVDDYGPRIETAIGRQVRWDSPLGCGSFGCVFPLVADPRRVLKLSTDPTEGPVVKAIIETGLDKQMHGLARWDAIWRIPEPIQPGPRGTCWVILREDVMPYQSDEFKKRLDEQTAPIRAQFGYLTDRQQWFHALLEYNGNARDFIRYKDRIKKRQANERMDEALGELYNNEETYYLAEAIEALSRNGIVIADVHAGNIGARIHSWEYDVPSGQGINLVHWFRHSSERGQTADGQPIAEGKILYQVHHFKMPAFLMFDPGHSSAPKSDVEALWPEPGMVLGNAWSGIEKAIYKI